jgi:hypothetical protein
MELVPVHPSVEIDVVEGFALGADGNLHQRRTDPRIELRTVHSQIGRGIANADKARENGNRHVRFHLPYQSAGIAMKGGRNSN